MKTNKTSSVAVATETRGTRNIMSADPMVCDADMDWTGRVAAELSKVGIDAVEEQDAMGFLDGVRIASGQLRYRHDAAPSNLLHEAGHLACLPPAFRPMANDDLSEVFVAMGSALEARMAETGNPDDPLIRAILQCSDPEATAWAYAFSVHVGIPERLAILDDEYAGTGAIVRMQVSSGRYLGVNGLRAAGMIGSVRSYPRMDKWLQDAM